MALTILITDRNLRIIGDPITRWTQVDMTLRFNEPGSGTITAAADGVSADQLAPGNRLVVIRNPDPLTGYPGGIVMAGPIEQPGAEEWSIDGTTSGAGTTTIGFASDEAAIVAEVAYPDPAHAITAQAASRRVYTAVSAETVMRSLVVENVGATALPARRIPKLALGPTAGVGAAVTMGFRLDPLGDALRSAALAGGGLGFRAPQVGDRIEFQVYQPRDLRGEVRFSRGLGNLRSYKYTPAAPTATVAIVGDGSGEGTTRTFVEVSSMDLPQWGRYVTVVDRRDTLITAELAAAGTEALAEAGASAQLESVTIDVPTQRYGVHYDLGDLVSVELTSGIEVADIVRAVTITVTPDEGEQVSAVVGTQSASTDPSWVAMMRAFGRRLARLEAI
ncbi:siphovirus ReqiPepy6 Gp37-like family protein [Krasilnikovia sp. MM14-A1259]|uniref:siphovirus ReqiPepy6 Gp37-like family protein n=1 Tax=Krasilnikovia sp. MM14-A1259 TaxID=3373539 RepID=UPI003803F5DF